MTRQTRHGRKKRTTTSVPTNALEAMLAEYLNWTQVRNYSEATVRNRRVHIGFFLQWCSERGLQEPVEITRPVLERYQRFLFHYRKKNGQPLSFHSQHSRMAPVRVWFKWLVKQNYLLANPASEIELPRIGYRLPNVLTIAEAEQVISQPDIHDTLGLRDRAILETLYSTGMRRLELIQLKLYDLDLARGIVTIRQGKGKKDRVIPIRRSRRGLDRKIPERSAAPPGVRTRRRHTVSFRRRRADQQRSSDFHGARLHRPGRDRQDGSLPPVPPHHGDADARRRSRYPFHPADARTRQTIEHANLHAGVDPHVEAGALHDSPGAAAQARSGDKRYESRSAESRAAGRSGSGSRRRKRIALPLF